MEVQVLEIAQWNTPASHYKIKQVGDYRIGKHTFQRGYYPYHGMDGYALFFVRQPFEATTLLQQRTQRLSWREWMIDSPTDYRAMQKYAAKAYGNVLTTGLGLGLVTHELCKNPDVNSITVIEISPNAIELIRDYLPNDSRIKIICQDFWQYIDQDNTKWDTIIVDLWVYWGRDQQIEMYKQEIFPCSEKLKNKYSDSLIFYHGFANMPTLAQIDKALVEGNDVDSLIYGLSDN